MSKKFTITTDMQQLRRLQIAVRDAFAEIFDRVPGETGRAFWNAALLRAISAGAGEARAIQIMQAAMRVDREAELQRIADDMADRAAEPEEPARLPALDETWRFNGVVYRIMGPARAGVNQGNIMGMPILGGAHIAPSDDEWRELGTFVAAKPLTEAQAIGMTG